MLSIFTLSCWYTVRQLGQRAGKLCFAASSLMRCQHHKHILYPHVQNWQARSVISSVSKQSGHTSASSLVVMVPAFRRTPDQLEISNCSNAKQSVQHAFHARGKPQCQLQVLPIHTDIVTLPFDEEEKVLLKTFPNTADSQWTDTRRHQRGVYLY